MFYIQIWDQPKMTPIFFSFQLSLRPSEEFFFGDTPKDHVLGGPKETLQVHQHHHLREGVLHHSSWGPVVSHVTPLRQWWQPATSPQKEMDAQMFVSENYQQKSEKKHMFGLYT